MMKARDRLNGEQFADRFNLWFFTPNDKSNAKKPTKYPTPILILTREEPGTPPFSLPGCSTVCWVRLQQKHVINN